MNVRLNSEMEFAAINVVDEHVLPNIYTVNLSMLTNSASHLTAIAVQRLNFCIKEIFNNGIFINVKHPLLKTFMSVVPQQIVALPDDAYDQVIGIALFCKLNAILEGNLTIEGLSISSRLGEGLCYIVDEDDNFGVFASAKKKQLPWWNRPDIYTVDIKNSDTNFEWGDVELAWNNEDNISVMEFTPDLIDEIREQVLAEEKTPRKTKKKESPEIIDFTDPQSEINPSVLEGGKEPNDKK